MKTSQTPAVSEYFDGYRSLRMGRDERGVLLVEFHSNGGPLFASFGNVAGPGVWRQVYDGGVQILENLANIRVPLIAAIEGQANVHSEYALMASVIVAGGSFPVQSKATESFDRNGVGRGIGGCP